MPITPLIKGLYAVTPDLDDTACLLSRTEAALAGGISVLQYRNKQASYAVKKAQALQLVKLCAAYHVPFLVNDHVSLCMEVDADGIHLGSTDSAIAAARRLLGAHKIIGVSCYNQPALAEWVRADGADYLTFGACFASTTKPAAVRAPLEMFALAKPLGLPLVAIGGITLENAPLAIAAGADAVAVISALFDSPDITATARAFAELFVPTTTP